MNNPSDERARRKHASIIENLRTKNKKNKKPYVTDTKGNPIVFNSFTSFNPLTEKNISFRSSAAERIDRTPELSARRARAIAYADSLPQAQKNLIADGLASKPGKKFSDLPEAIQLIDAVGTAGAKDNLLSKNDANTFLKRVISRSNSVMSESLRSDSSVDPDMPIEVQGKFNKIYENKKVLDFFDVDSYVFSLNKKCHISYNIDPDTDEEGNHIINITFFTCAPFAPIPSEEEGGWGENITSIKGSGALMMMDLLSFLVKQGLNGYKYKTTDYVYLQPEPIGDERYEDGSMADLYRYYMSLNFGMAGHNTMRATIREIFRSPRAKGVIENFQNLTKPSDSAGKGGRRKLTKKKRTRRKSRKSRKTKTIRKRK
jgi:hypothetical protein